jgi:endonuclease YncB( thermonuclease family)
VPVLLAAILLLVPAVSPADTHRCDWVYDGDTIRLEGGERVRLLGVDAPEVHHPERGEEPFGREAMGLAIALVSGRTVELRYHEGDSIENALRDKYDRVLAYVWVDRLDGLGRREPVCLNLELLRQGLARATRAWAHPQFDAYVEAELDARSRGAGLWAGAPSRPAGQVLITPGGSRYHRRGCPHIRGHRTSTLSRAAAEKRGRTPCRTCRP